jgi:hypothetical protein
MKAPKTLVRSRSYLTVMRHLFLRILPLINSCSNMRVPTYAIERRRYLQLVIAGRRELQQDTSTFISQFIIPIVTFFSLPLSSRVNNHTAYRSTVNGAPRYYSGGEKDNFPIHTIKAYRGSEDTTILTLTLGIKWRWSASNSGRFIPGVGSRAGLNVSEINLLPVGIRTPSSPSHSPVIILTQLPWLLLIREAPCLNSSSVNCYSHMFSSGPPGKCRSNTSNRP